MINDALKQRMSVGSFAKENAKDKLYGSFKIAQLSQSTWDYITHIDFILFFKRKEVRVDLVHRFSIATA